LVHKATEELLMFKVVSLLQFITRTICCIKRLTWWTGNYADL